MALIDAHGTPWARAADSAFPNRSADREAA
jgi:hypothetical protein